jgi:hypothetical protein
LETLAGSGFTDNDGRFALWSEIGKLLGRHKKYPDAPWADTKHLQEQLETIRDKIAPTDPARKHRWLFERWVELPDVDIRKNLEAHDRALHEARLAALREIVTQDGAEGVFRSLDLGADPNTVGGLIGANALLDWSAIDLPGLLESPDDRRKEFVASFIRWQFWARQWAFVDSLPVDRWSDAQVAAFACSLPFEESTWKWLAKFSSAARTLYWRRAVAFLRRPSFEELRIATDALVEASRWLSAVQLLHFAVSDDVAVPSELIADVLEAGLKAESEEQPDRSGQFMYAVQSLVKRLQGDAGFDRSRLAWLEWQLLAVLDARHGGVGPVTLTSAIESEPQFVVELLRAVYRGEHDRPGTDVGNEQDQLRAQNAYRLLEGLTRLPGMREDKTIDWDALRGWMKEVQRLASESDRRGVGDLFLGQLIGRTSRRLDDEWEAGQLAAIIEELGTENLVRGFVNGVLNSQGVVSRAPDAGGGLERTLAERYRRMAERSRRTSGQLAGAFLQLAEVYEHRAKEEDDEAERQRLGKY